MQREHCAGCTRLAIMFVQIGAYRLWMCEAHARKTQETLTALIDDVDQTDFSVPAYKERGTS